MRNLALQSFSNVPRLPCFWNYHDDLMLCSLFARYRIHCAGHEKSRLNVQNQPRLVASLAKFFSKPWQWHHVSYCKSTSLECFCMPLHPPPTPAPSPKSTASSLASCMCASATELHIHIEWHHVCIQMLMTLSHPQTTQNTQNPTPKHKLCPLGWYLRFPMGSLTAPVTNARPNRAWKIGSPSLRV